ncbi:hypothetical protein GGD65_008180 [Bradyrhizobium sp. CIR18]|uniref:hypothetical protein n=1 Tax=Bradyrhizobium sp. CIR18 TaxID=2663839 RepID=UPI001606070B|nr:hypothetical protein [Bradyrhizobium sp. CIR18]MBB4367104.1 hypothetical protein [Bradyrhizobium sp. CIR18]
MVAERKPEAPRLGVINLDGLGYPDTIDLPDPFSGPPPEPDEPSGNFINRSFWPFPVAYAIAAGTWGGELAEGQQAAIESVAEAAERLAPHCDLIVGNCGGMYYARRLIKTRTPALLSALELLPYALESSTLPVGILTMSKDFTEKMLKSMHAGDPGLSRLRIVGVSDQPAWGSINRDWYVRKPRISPEDLRREILEVCLRERDAGAFKNIGSIVLECTAMPQFRQDVVAALRLPTWDIAAFAKGLLGA